MLPHYMGLTNPIENDFELSVSGAPFLVTAKFRERISLSGDVRLFLWEGEDEHSIALFHRAKARLKDRQLFVHVPLKGFDLEVRGVAPDAKYWPITSSSPSAVRIYNGHLAAPVMAALRRNEADAPHYLIARGISFEDFRRRLINSEIIQRRI